MTPLRNYQKRADRIARVLELQAKREKIGLFLMMDIGLGKTAVAIQAIKRCKGPTLVIAPVQVCWLVWPDELKKWAPELTWTVLHGPKKDKRIRLKRDVYICPYSSLKWFYKTLATTGLKVPKMFLILDESTYIKDPSTQRFKYLKRLRSIFKNFSMCLSATPTPNGLHELWSQVFLLDYGKRLKQTFTSFRNKYFMYTGPPVYKTIPLKGTSDKIFNKIKDVTFRLDGKDYLSLPPITYNKIKVCMPSKLMYKYKELEKEFFIQLKENSVEVFNAAALSMKLRQFLQGALYINACHDYEEIHHLKLDTLDQLIESNPNKPLLCVINFRFEYEIMKNRYKKPPAIFGGTPSKDKRIYIKQWNRGNVPLMLCHPASMSHGLNLQTGGNIIVWMALPWSLDQFHQLNGRLHRQGQKKGVIVNNLCFENTVDEVVEEVLRSKDKTQKELLEALRKYSKSKGV